MKHHGCLICAGTSRAAYCGPCATSRFFQESWSALGMAAQQRAEVLSRLDAQLAVKVRMPVPVPLVCACNLAQFGISFQLEHAFGCMLKHVWPTLQADLEQQQLEHSRRLKTLREASLRASAAGQQLKAGGWLQECSARHALVATQISRPPSLVLQFKPRHTALSRQLSAEQRVSMQHCRR